MIAPEHRPALLPLVARCLFGKLFQVRSVVGPLVFCSVVVGSCTHTQVVPPNRQRGGRASKDAPAARRHAVMLYFGARACLCAAVRVSPPHECWQLDWTRRRWLLSLMSCYEHSAYLGVRLFLRMHLPPLLLACTCERSHWCALLGS